MLDIKKKQRYKVIVIFKLIYIVETILIKIYLLLKMMIINKNQVIITSFGMDICLRSSEVILGLFINSGTAHQ